MGIFIVPFKLRPQQHERCRAVAEAVSDDKDTPCPIASDILAIRAQYSERFRVGRTTIAMSP